MLTIASLLQTAHLGLTLLGGEQGTDRHVMWAHVSEIEDSAAWLDGGELILSTGIGLPDEEEGQVKYIERLAAVDAAGLAVGHRSSGITAGAIARADELAFPLMTVDADVPYLVISRFVAAANHDSAMRRLVAHVQLFDSLRAKVTESLDSAELFQRLAAVSKMTLHVVSASGRSILPGLDDAPEHLRAAIPHINHSSPSLDGGYGVPVPFAGRTAAYVLALAPDQSHIGLTAVRHIATIAALEIATLYSERERERRAGSETLAQLMSAKVDLSHANRQLAEAGFETSALVVLVAHPLDGAPSPDEEVFHRFRDDRIPCLMLTNGDALIALLPHEPAAIEHALADLPLHAGYSEPFSGAASLSVGRVQAMWAAEGARRAHRTARTVRFGDDDIWTMWLPHDADRLEMIAARILGPLIAYDSDHGTSLLETLQTYLQNDRRAAPTAEVLCIHSHTLNYRLRRIAEITGRSASSVNDSAEFWFALRARELAKHPRSRLA